MENLLPQELIMEVLSHLPAESVFRFKSVCKAWRALLDDPYFGHLHTDKLLLHYDRIGILVTAGMTWVTKKLYLEDLDYEDDDEQVCKSFSNNLNRPLPPPFDVKRGHGSNIIGSCNGLVCLSLTNYINPCLLYVYNPTTSEYFKLPNNDHDILKHDAHHRCFSEGFGFHPITREYKIIRIHSFRQSADSNVWNMQIHIYTLGSGIWRIKQGLQTPYDAYFRFVGVPFNGSVYWMSQREENICSIDLEHEEFQTIAPPPPGPNSSTSPKGKLYRLVVLGGNLCIFERLTNGIDIWAMKSKNTQQGCSWSRYCNIPSSIEINQGPNTPDIASCETRYFKPLLLTKSGKVVCMCSYERTLISFDPKTESCFLLKRFQLKGGVLDWRNITYMKSIVSLKAFGEEDVKMTVSKAPAPLAEVEYHP